MFLCFRQPLISRCFFTFFFTFYRYSRHTLFNCLSIALLTDDYLTFQIVWFLSNIKQAHLTATSLVEALEDRRKGKRFLLSLWEFFSCEEYSSDDISIEERRRVPVLLATAQQQLIDIFQVIEFPLYR